MHFNPLPLTYLCPDLMDQGCQYELDSIITRKEAIFVSYAKQCNGICIIERDGLTSGGLGQALCGSLLVLIGGRLVY